MKQKRFSHEWRIEKAKEIFESKKPVTLYIPSGRTANFLAWRIIDLINKSLPEEKRANKSIRTAMIGRFYIRNFIDNYEYLSYEYDYETKKARYVVSLAGNLKNNPQEIAETKFQEKIDKLVTPKDRELFKKQGDTSEKSMEDITVITKLFNPAGAGTWYLYEDLGDDIFMCFANLGDPVFAELGTVSLKELAEYDGPLGIGIERDKFFKPMNLKEIYDKVKNFEHV